MMIIRVNDIASFTLEVVVTTNCVMTRIHTSSIIVDTLINFLLKMQ